MKKKGLISLLFIALVLTGCGAGASDGAAAGDMNSSMDATTDSYLEYGKPEFTEDAPAESVTSNRKIIERIFMNVETKEFDDLIVKISQEISKAGGYVERSNVSGNSFYYEGHRYAELTIRVPSDKSDGFSEFVSQNSTVTSKEITTDDVTLAYIDAESRVIALETEKASLEKLLAAAETLEDIIKIQDRLTDVIYEIESYQSQLRTYDNLIDFTTITIYISEVEKVSVVEEQTVWQEIGTKLSNNFSDIGDGAVAIFVFLVSNIPYLAILGVVAGVAIMIGKKIKKN